ncbi:transposase for insertion sequence element IS231E [Bacillus wiedmannii]|uniref:hypothetical protein n=1 Tax=Bacillus wiedmannii TaxID=1890302 RepID=UPI000278D31E|nr:hypothetical protein [Bacillus wiedmannii]EJQ40321.1 transposase for insertion sequence element IS231E [Bacillus wiedmannii]
MNLSIQGELQLFAEELHQHLTPSFLENLARELTFVQGVPPHRYQANKTKSPLK